MSEENTDSFPAGADIARALVSGLGLAAGAVAARRSTERNLYDAILHRPGVREAADAASRAHAKWTETSRYYLALEERIGAERKLMVPSIVACEEIMHQQDALLATLSLHAEEWIDARRAFIKAFTREVDKIVQEQESAEGGEAEGAEREDVTPQGEWSGDRGMAPEAEPTMPPSVREGYIEIGRAAFREVEERAKSSDVTVEQGAILGMAAFSGGGRVLRVEAESLDRSDERHGSTALSQLVAAGLLRPPVDIRDRYALTTHGAIYVRALLSMDNGPLASTLEVVEYAAALIAHLDQTGVCDVCGADASDFDPGKVPHHEGTVCWNLARAVNATGTALPEPRGTR